MAISSSPGWESAQAGREVGEEKGDQYTKWCTVLSEQGARTESVERKEWDVVCPPAQEMCTVGEEQQQVRGMRHGGDGYHEEECECEECAKTLHGQLLFYSMYSGRRAEKPEELHRWVTEALQSWLPKPWTADGRDGRRVAVAGSEQVERSKGQARVVYRFLVALPYEVQWGRLWEKLLYKRGSKQTGLSFQQVDNSTDGVNAYVWHGMSGVVGAGPARKRVVSSFTWYTADCSRYIRPQRRTTPFGTLEEGREAFRRWMQVRREIQQKEWSERIAYHGEDFVSRKEDKDEKRGVDDVEKRDS